jgi:hypothetical protein
LEVIRQLYAPAILTPRKEPLNKTLGGGGTPELVLSPEKRKMSCQLSSSALIPQKNTQLISAYNRQVIHNYYYYFFVLCILVFACNTLLLLASTLIN